MNIYLIGRQCESNNAIISFASENNLQLYNSNEIDSLDSFFDAIQEALKYDVVILDILEYNLDNKEFELGLKELTSKYNGIIIVYAPSASYNDSRITICNDFGVNNVIRDFLTARAKARLRSMIPLPQEETSNSDIPEKEQKVEKEESIQAANKNEVPAEAPINPSTDNYGKNMVNQNTQYFVKESKPEDVVITKKIGVIGVLPRIGTTTQAVLITSLLTTLGKSACYIQYHDSSFLDNMENYFAGVEKSTKGCLVYEGLDFYKNRNLVLSQNYEYQIHDYGNCAATMQIPSDFFNNDIRIIVCGGTAEEVSSLTALRTQLYVDSSLLYVFSFIADYEKDDIYDLMSEKAANTLFAPYNPDCFNCTEESKNVYMPVFGFTVEEKKKRVGLFRRKGK